MTLRLRDLTACFEGVVPSIIATAAADGTPNVSYLSHVVMIDDEHVGLSNQFFTQTARNLRDNPQATILLVDGRHGAQVRLEARFIETINEGPLFNTVATQLNASSAQVGMAGIMRLRGVDVFHVSRIELYPSPVDAPIEPPVEEPRLNLCAALARTIGDAREMDTIVDAVLDGLTDVFGYESAFLLLSDLTNRVLTTVSSRGYPRSGIGSEVAFGDGIIGAAALDRRIVKVSDMSRVRRYSAAVEASSLDENRTRTVALPGRSDSLSQIAVPMMANGVLHGVLAVESQKRLAFSAQDEAALTVIASQTAAALALSEALSREPQDIPPQRSAGSRSGRSFQIVHHAFDDSVFIEGEYMIKGVAGRLLIHMIEIYCQEGRTTFTNREIRLSKELRLPDIKDNLETRLLLLRRRLADKGSPIRMNRTGRGQFSLEFEGVPILERVLQPRAGDP
jgi:adenylate cyclase